MNTHEQINELLADYVLGELPEPKSAEVKAHLALCPACRRECQRLEALEQCTHQIWRLSVEQKTCESARKSLRAAMDLKKTEKITTRPKVGPVLIWRSIMKSKVSKLTAAAAVLIGVIVIGFWSGNNGGAMAYGMADIPQLLQNTDRLHVSGWAFLPEDMNNLDNNYKKLPFEYWFDVENGRMRLHKPALHDQIKNNAPQFYETVLDGVYRMEKSYYRPAGGEWTPEIKYTRLSPFTSRFETYRSVNSQIMQIFGHIDTIESFTKCGEEEISGVIYDIWEGEIFPSEGRGFKIKSWLCPETGEIGRAFFWLKISRQDTQWHPVMEINKLERNIELSADIFNTDPPPNIKLTNSKETAPLVDIANVNNPMNKPYFSIHLLYTLTNGSVLVCWSTYGVGGSAQQQYSELEFGGKLPELPAKITGLKPLPNPENIQFQGYHLTHTKSKNCFYEWAIYVPNQKMPSRNAFMGYELTFEFNVDKNMFEVRPSNMRSDDIIIRNQQDFDRWILGAMAELSGDGEAPDYVTYDFVLRICEDIRGSVPK